MSAIIKKSRNIYEGIEFNNYPYDTNQKFSVYIPKDNDSILDHLNHSIHATQHHHHSQTRSLPKYLDPIKNLDQTTNNNTNLPIIYQKNNKISPIILILRIITMITQFYCHLM